MIEAARGSARVGWGLALAVAAAAPARAEPWRATLEVGGEVDTNVQRVESDAGEPETAPVARSQAELIRRDRHGGWRSIVRGLLAVRDVVAGPVTTENLLTAAADVAVERAGVADAVALLGRATYYDVIPLDGVAGTRAFTSSGADLGLRLDGGEGRSATVTASVRDLVYKADHDFDWSGPAAAVTVADELWRGDDDATLELRAAYRLERRGYRGRAFRNGCAPGEQPSLACFVPTDEARHDLHHVVGMTLTYSGERVLAASYELIGDDSSSYGSSFVRHRLTASATTSAPGDLFVTAAVTAQLDRYIDPLLLARDVSSQTFESVDEENRSALSLRVARALTPSWQLEARAAYYANAFAADDHEFHRFVVYAGLTWETAPNAE